MRPGSAKSWRTAVLAAILLPLCAPAHALAIPAFARRYQTSCTTCHVVIPKLNAFGIAFRNNGYRIPPNDERYVRIPDVPLGAPAWKRLWPEALWPGGIPGVAPIAFRILNDVVVDPDRAAQVDFVFPYEVEILAGGTAGEGISYFVELAVNHDNGVDLERAFIQFDQMGGTTLANLIVGRFEIRAVPFSRVHRRLTPTDFLAMDFRNPADGLHLRRPQAGLEFWGAKSGKDGKGGLEYAVGVVNGNGPFSDNNTAKDAYGRLSYKFGGFGVAGSNADAPDLVQTKNWRDNSVKVGLSSYVGKGDFASGEDRFLRLGGDVDVFIGDLNVSTVVLHGRDTIRATKVSTEFTAASAEANYVVKPWVVAIVRYDTVLRDSGGDVRRVVPAVALSLRANVRLVADWEAFLKSSFDGVRQASGESRARVRLELVF